MLYLSRSYNFSLNSCEDMLLRSRSEVVGTYLQGFFLSEPFFPIVISMFFRAFFNLSDFPLVFFSKYGNDIKPEFVISG